MQIIIVRHAEPDYTIDNLTKKGKREADLLKERLLKREYTEVLSSPLGRAIATAKPYLKATNKQARILSWLQEFPVKIYDDYIKTTHLPWDFMPADWTNSPKLYDKDLWFTDQRLNADVKTAYDNICNGIDSLLATYGYKRKGNMYETADKGNDTTLLIFCHLGAGLAIFSHLTGASPVYLWQSIYVAPTSITTIVSEERESGKVQFRATAIGDTSHLYVQGEEISHSGLFDYPVVKL